MNRTILLPFLLLCSLCSFGQDENHSLTKQGIWTMTLPHNADGPLVFTFNYDYSFTREYIGEKCYVNLDFVITNIDISALEGGYGFRHEGKTYFANEISRYDQRGLEGFDDIVITSFTIHNLSVRGTGALAPPFNMSTSMESKWHAAEATKYTDLDQLTLDFSGTYARDVNYDQSYVARKRIFDYINRNQGANDNDGSSSGSTDDDYSDEENGNDSDEEDNDYSSGSQSGSSGSSGSGTAGGSGTYIGTGTSGSETPYVSPYGNYSTEPDYELAAAYAGQAISYGVELFNDWQAERERKWALERDAYQRHQTSVAESKAAYEQLTGSTDAHLQESLDNYCTMLKSDVPDVLSKTAISWEEILGTDDYNSFFGKKIEYVSKKVTVGIDQPSLMNSVKNGYTEKLVTPDILTPQELTVITSDRQIYYWVKTDFHDHYSHFIFDQNNILVGMRISLLTDSQYDPIHIKDYYDDLIANLDSRYFMADGNTFVTRDKVCILDFNYLTILDLNYLQPSTRFDFPDTFDNYFQQAGQDVVLPIGVKIHTVADEKAHNPVLKEVLKGSPAEKAGLIAGDVVLKMNEVTIDHPFHLQLFSYAYPEAKTITVTVRRNNELKTLYLNL